MSRETYAKLHAFQVIEDLLTDSRNDNNQQNWLLSYLDVFILIIMLVITLLAITDFATPSHDKQTNKKIAKKQIKSLKKKSEKKSITKKPQLKPVSQPNKKQEIEAISLHKPKSVSLKVIAKKIVTSKQKKPEIKEIAKTIQPKLFPLDSTKPEIRKPPAIEKKTVTAKQESSEIKTSQSKAVDKPITKESDPQTEKQPIQESNNPANAWQNQLKKQLDQLESVNVKIKEGYAQIEIQDNILYESAQASLTEEGKALLKKLTDLLKQSTGIIFIEGHTDNQPIATKQFPSNWELGSARATSVLHFLTSQDLNSQRLRAVTYADTMPLSDNSTEEGRKKNRRVNLLVKIPEL
jgi:chemotaxis protein MotB